MNGTALMVLFEILSVLSQFHDHLPFRVFDVMCVKDTVREKLQMLWFLSHNENSSALLFHLITFYSLLPTSPQLCSFPPLLSSLLFPSSLC